MIDKITVNRMLSGRDLCVKFPMINVLPDQLTTWSFVSYRFQGRRGPNPIVPTAGQGFGDHLY